MSEGNQHPSIRSRVDQTALVKLSEECNEAAQAAMKSLLHGIDSYHIHTGKPNVRQLEEEIADVYAIFEIVKSKYRLDEEFIMARTVKKVELHLDMGLLTLEELIHFINERKKNGS